MRSTKNRSRSKGNRNRSNSGGNIVNRVFDSSGPEGKVRGTPQQIIEKYNQLTRDAQLSNDRVAAENFQQHAEHYLRLLSEAQREIDQRREEQERQNRERQAERDRERSERQDRDSNQQGGQNHQDSNDSRQNDANDQRSNDSNDQRSNDNAPQQPKKQQPAQNEPAAQDNTDDDDSGLVETPESKPKPKPKRAPRRKPKPKGEDDAAQGNDGNAGGDQSTAAE